MLVSTITGATPQDYIALYAETIQECAQLVQCGNSEFIRDDSTALLTGFANGKETVVLHIFVGKKLDNAMTEEMRRELDNES